MYLQWCRRRRSLFVYVSMNIMTKKYLTVMYSLSNTHKYTNMYTNVEIERMCMYVQAKFGEIQ